MEPTNHNARQNAPMQQKNSKNFWTLLVVMIILLAAATVMAVALSDNAGRNDMMDDRQDAQERVDSSDDSANGLESQIDATINFDSEEGMDDVDREY